MDQRPAKSHTIPTLGLAHNVWLCRKQQSQGQRNKSLQGVENVTFVLRSEAKRKVAGVNPAQEVKCCCFLAVTLPISRPGPHQASTLSKLTSINLTGNLNPQISHRIASQSKHQTPARKSSGRIFPVNHLPTSIHLSPLMSLSKQHQVRTHT